MKELEKLMNEKESLRRKWLEKKAETEKKIAELTDKLNSDEVVSDYAKFSAVKTDIEDLKAYAKQIENILIREATPTPEEKATYERLFNEAKKECEDILKETGDYLAIAGVGILNKIEEVEAKQKDIDTKIKALAKCYGIHDNKSVLTKTALSAYVSIMNVKSGFEVMEEQRKKGLPL